MNTSDTKAIAVLGAGSWGTALALLLARRNHTVYLWDHNPARVEDLLTHRCNRRYLPEFQLPSNIHPIKTLAETAAAEDILMAVPSHAFAEVLKELQKHMNPHQGLISASKGLEPKTGQRLDEVIAQINPALKMAVLSGPTFAREVARDLPTAVTLASKDLSFLKKWSTILHHATFRVYTSDDVIGVEIAAVVKNVIAIAVGVSDALGYGANARAALMTRGVAEMTRLGITVGGQATTFTGLAGMGDLVLTCTDDQSRNRRFGLALGQGLSAAAAHEKIGQIVEGADNCATLAQLAERHQVDMPIVKQVLALLNQQISAEEAAQNLLLRPPQNDTISSC